MRLAAAVACLPLLFAAPASAAVRYAAPAGSGSDCSASAPCSLPTAFTSLGANTEIVLATGDYGSPESPLALTTTAPGVSLHGVAAPASTRVFVNGFALSLGGAGSSVSNLDVESVEPGGNSLALYVGPGSLVDRVIAHHRGHLTDFNQPVAACESSGGATWRDSVCWTTDANAMFVLGGGTTQLRNMTISAATTSPSTTYYALVLNGDAGATVSASNTIVLNGIHGNASTQFAYDHCDTTGPFELSGPVTTGAGNTTVAPVLVDPGHGDFHEAPLSGATIDQGVADPTLSADVDGDLRLIGSAPDIGADELADAPEVTAPTVAAVATDTATVQATIDPGGSATAYHVEYGPTTAYGTSTGDTVLPASTSSAPTATPLGGLSPATTYHARLVATNSRASVVSADVTFTTAAAPAPAPPSPGMGSPPPGMGMLTLDPAHPAVTLVVPKASVAATSVVALSVANNTDESLDASGQLVGSSGARAAAARTVALSTVTRRRIAPHTKVKLTLKLTRAARARLRRGRVRARFVVKLRNAAGVRATVSRTVVLRRRR